MHDIISNEEDILPANNINEQILSVSQISNYLKELVEQNFEYVKIRGEILGFKLATSGHAYFNLKDQQATLACTCWRQAMSKVTFQIQDGLEVVVIGKMTTYSGQSKYQLTANIIEPYGLGSLTKILEQRKNALAQEGIFALERKKSLPFLPRTIGVVTSLSGVVILDILHRIKERFPTKVLIWPVSVQGETAAQEVAAAIKGFNEQEGELRPQVIIVARGGGSIEDLWAFNEEVVVRAAAASMIPLVSAIGHETDHTLLDLVADLRAPTPTAAAELVVPVLTELLENLAQIEHLLTTKVHKFLNDKTNAVQLYRYQLARPLELLSRYEQRLDFLSLHLASSLPRLFQLNYLKIANTSSYLLTAHKTLALLTAHLNTLSGFLQRSVNQYLQHAQRNLELLVFKLKKSNIHETLERGFAVLYDPDGQNISSVAQVTIGQEVKLYLRDGQLKITVNSIDKKILQ